MMSSKLAPFLLLVAGVIASGAVRADEPAPPSERPVEDVRIRVRETGSGARVEAENLRRVAYELRLEHGDDVTFRILPPLATTTVLELDGLSHEEAVGRLRERWRFVSFMGDPAAIEPDEGHMYRLPFRAGKSYRLSQGFHGKQSHDRETSRYALDFQLEVGEPVHAARDGLVVKVVDWFRGSGGPERREQANLIVVLHDDGTMGHYVHLDHGGALVAEGDRVERGQPIGVSGMTGFTRGPHLHFVVRRERDIAVPIRFEGYEDRDLSKPGRFRVASKR